MTQLGLQKYLFVLEILIAEYMFTRRLTKRRHYYLRLVGGVAVSFLAALLFPLPKGWYNGWYVSLMFFVLFAITFASMLFCYKVHTKNIFFCCLAAYTVQHLAYEIFRLSLLPFTSVDTNNMYGAGIVDLTRITLSDVLVAFAYFDFFVAVYGISYFTIGKKIARNGDLHIKSTRILMLSAAVLLVDIIMNAFTVYIVVDYNALYDILMIIYNCLCCVFALTLQHSIVANDDIKDELGIVEGMLKNAQTQYEMRRDEIDMINIKCHDLKHRLANYTDMTAVKEMNELISLYDANIQTKNKVTDIILTDKSIACHGKDITLICMADCSKLTFVSDGDLYALFGNILDNAIESVQKLDSDSRAISLNVRSAAGFVSIMEENYYKGEIVFENGLPKTVKDDTSNHGFGLKSIRHIAEKYGGDMSIVCGDGVFRINVLFPIPA